eukprot:TRINITY_DN17078_c0_g1_i1.p1 TRINITY_DN17078_c0_g1~~TRINITY_DN17078_c0_g1_i1.p1  ORF type:complete len:186 (+),score=15.21 TRINITY_DN17078_c0_g1_i1:147-704(+)
MFPTSALFSGKVWKQMYWPTRRNAKLNIHQDMKRVTEVHKWLRRYNENPHNNLPKFHDHMFEPKYVESKKAEREFLSNTLPLTSKYSFAQKPFQYDPNLTLMGRSEKRVTARNDSVQKYLESLPDAPVRPTRESIQKEKDESSRIIKQARNKRRNERKLAKKAASTLPRTSPTSGNSASSKVASQ